MQMPLVFFLHFLAVYPRRIRAAALHVVGRHAIRACHPCHTTVQPAVHCPTRLKRSGETGVWGWSSGIKIESIMCCSCFAWPCLKDWRIWDTWWINQNHIVLSIEKRYQVSGLICVWDCAWGNMIVVRTQELAYIFERYTLCFLFRTRQPFFKNMLPKCAVPKWPNGPNLLKLKNRENDSGSNPPFSTSIRCQAKKGKKKRCGRAVVRDLIPFCSKTYVVFHQRRFSWPVACHLCFWWNVLAHHDHDEVKGLHLSTGFAIWKESMRNHLLSSTAVWIGSSSPVDTWINENSQKSICCRFNGFLLWIVRQLGEANAQG